MFKTRKDQVRKTFRYSTGEEIYELIGTSGHSGNSKTHSFSYGLIPAGCFSRPHYHHEIEETFYFVEGKGKMTVDDKEFDVEPGDTFLITPSEKHQVINNSENNLEFIVVCSPAWNPDDSVYLD